MKITSISTQHLQVPLKTTFKTALRTVTELEDIVLMIRTDTGNIGYGEGAAAAVITGETLASIEGAVEYLRPLILNQDIHDFNALLQTVSNSLIYNTTLKSMVEMALYDLRAQSFKVPLYQFLGGSQTKFTTDITISFNDIDTMIKEAQKAIDLGYSVLKIKVGESIVKDYERIRIIAQTFPNTILRIDANQAWSAKETVTILQRLEKQNIVTELIEQPVKANDFRGMRYIKERTLTPLLADESIFSAKQAIELLEMDACDMINIKLAKCGGITQALQIADIAKLYDTKCMLGCMLEGPISVGAALHVASARADTITMLDLDGANLLATNPVVGGVAFDESRLMLSNEIGLGIQSISAL